MQAPDLAIQAPDPAMRALWFVPEYPPNPGGIATFARVIGRRLDGVDLTILVGWDGPERLLDGTIEVIREPIRSAFEAGNAAEVLRYRRRLAELKREVGADIYHLHVIDPSPILHLQTIDVTPAPTVFTLHNEMLELFSVADPESALARMLDASDVITGVSSSSARGATDAVTRLAQRIVTIPNGVEVPPSAQPMPGTATIVAIGRLTEQKGFDRLIAAMPEVVAAHPDVELSIIGDGPEREPIEAQVVALGLENNVRLHGHVDRAKVAELLGRHQIVVSASRFEGLPYALLEASAAGRPVVAPDVGGINEVVVHGRTGLLVDGARLDHDPSELAGAIIDLLDDPELAGRLGRAARARIERHFSAEVCASRYVQVYRSLRTPETDIAIVIPAFNASRHLAAALDSVIADRATVPHLTMQILVVDDGSDDDTAAVARRYADRGVELWEQPNTGSSMARNAGTALTRSTFVAHLDADDVWPIGRTEALWTAIADRPDLDAVFGRAAEFVDADAPPNVRWTAEPFAVRMPTCGLIRRDAIERIGGFTSNPDNDQVEWSARAIGRGLVYDQLDALVLRRRIHATNKSHERPFNRDRSRVAILKAALDARRSANA